MAWRADFRGLPSTLCLAAASGRHGADNVAGGLSAAAPQGGSALVCALPLAGGTKKMACWGAASVVAKGAGRRPGGADALLYCDAVAGGFFIFLSHSWLVLGTP